MSVFFFFFFLRLVCLAKHPAVRSLSCSFPGKHTGLFSCHSSRVSGLVRLKGSGLGTLHPADRPNSETLCQWGATLENVVFLVNTGTSLASFTAFCCPSQGHSDICVCSPGNRMPKYPQKNLAGLHFCTMHTFVKTPHFQCVGLQLGGCFFHVATGIAN